MKKALILGLAISLAISCSKSESSSIPDHNDITVTSTPEPVVKKDSIGDLTKNIDEGKALIEGADCLTCHKSEEKLIGPSYLDIAGKYENNPANVDLLAEKIIAGGSGVWGSIPMSAHPGMSKENAKKMVTYILSLKN
ncbi:c-type cytochrome [Kaistella montana]|uniref:C-type cytochrome n=1 Tax=Kaistella montana TaxID=1849733 RepID=A0ABW5K9U2_9FLAO|nr:c-type cytochrome [Kaistella montana]MCQ4035022.1 c-type cytochrome [Kaistella montana]